MDENEKLEQECRERFKTVREHFKLSQRELAKKLGISNTLISQIENGERNVTTTILRKLADIVNIDPTWMLLGCGPFHLDEMLSRGGPPSHDPEFEELVQTCRESSIVRHAMISQYMIFHHNNKAVVQEDLKVKRSEKKK